MRENEWGGRGCLRGAKWTTPARRPHCFELLRPAPRCQPWPLYTAEVQNRAPAPTRITCRSAATPPTRDALRARRCVERRTLLFVRPAGAPHRAGGLRANRPHVICVVSQPAVCSGSMTEAEEDGRRAATRSCEQQRRGQR